MGQQQQQNANDNEEHDENAILFPNCAPFICTYDMKDIFNIKSCYIMCSCECACVSESKRLCNVYITYKTHTYWSSERTCYSKLKPHQIKPPHNFVSLHALEHYK